MVSSTLPSRRSSDEGPATVQERVERSRSQALTAIAAFLRDPQLTEQIDQLIGLARLEQTPRNRGYQL